VAQPDVLRRLGLFIVERFLQPALCADVRSAMRDATVRKAGTVGTRGADFVVDRTVRRVTNTTVPPALVDTVRTRMLALKPDLERAFDVTLTDCQNPSFLHYVTGDFYQRHRDASARADASAVSTARRVSVVVFLNAPAREPAEGSYGGGALTFYELFEGEKAKGIGLPLDAAEGLLVAFRADLPHSVTPVTHGDRFTIATWFV
jgi:predicted 2-oxoglutarate/Fe(II)-dependent dioxygenase YbiX